MSHIVQIQAEVRKQIEVAEFASKDVVARLQAQVDELRKQLPGQSGAKKKAPAKKAAAKKTAGAKKSPAKKTAAAKKKAPAKKAAAKKA